MCLAIPPNCGRSHQYGLQLSLLLDGDEPETASSSTAATGRAASPPPPEMAPCGLGLGGGCYGGLGPTGLSPVGIGGAARPPFTFIPETTPSTSSVPSSMATTAAAAAKKPASTTAGRRRRRDPLRPGKTATHKERLFVQHDYHDLSGEPDVPHDGVARKAPEVMNPPGSPHLLSESFPMKLHRILEESEAAGLGHIISWMPHGRAFKIHKPKLFTAQVMTNYFPKMRKLTSLQRQFNLYGFERLTREGPDAGSYYHEAFLRHRPGLSTQRMFRKRIKGTGYKAASNPEAEPDLYAFPSMDEVMARKRQTVTNAQQDLPVANGFGVVKHYSGFPSCSYATGSKDPEVVTESTRSSYYSSSGDSTSSTHQDPMQQQHQFVAAPVPSNLYVPQAQAQEQSCYMSHYMSHNCSNTNNSFCQETSRNQQARPSIEPSASLEDTMRNTQRASVASLDMDATMDTFLALPEETQDSYLRDYFSANDVTPMSPVSHRRNSRRSSLFSLGAATTFSIGGATTSSNHGASLQQHQQEDKSILQEFADLWENASTF